MKWKLALVVMLSGLLIAPLFSLAQSQRGQGTRPRQSAGAGRYYALLIAVQNYQHPSVTPLDYPLADAQRLRKVLTEDYNFDQRDVTLLADPDRDAILTAFEQLADRLQADDHLLIFYAGHGYWDEQRRQGYWLPGNAQRGRRADWISNSDLRDAIRAVPARHTLLVSDACFSGGIFVAREAFTRPAAIEELSRLPSRNAMTSGALTTVPDRSVFVEYLVKRLGENREPYLPAADLFSQLRTPVINNSPRQADGSIPTPRYGVIQEAGDEGGDFIFVRREAAPVPTPAPTTRSTPTPKSAVAYARVAGPPMPLLSLSFTTARVDALGNVTRLPGQSAIGFAENLGNGVKLEMVEIAGGGFTMGSLASEPRRGNDEKQHEVTVSDFYLGRYEVTQVQWKAVMGSLPPNSPLIAGYEGDQMPVVMVSWELAKEFCTRLNNLLKLNDLDGYRLPTEAEWEYAARAGTATPVAFGETITPEVGNYDGNFSYGQGPKGVYRQHPVVVGSLGYANAYGLFDMHGNMLEWCEDWYAEYPSGTVKDPRGPTIGSRRVVRGGAFRGDVASCRSAWRTGGPPKGRNDDLGFRLSRTVSRK